MLEDYLDILEDKVAGYEGDYRELIIAAPDILRLLDDLLGYGGLTREHRQHITAAIAYFVSPYDVLSEPVFGYMGYIDDLYLASYTLRRVLDDLPVDVVEGFWKGEGDLRSVVDEVYDTSSRLLGSKVGEILVYVGLE